MDDPESAKGPEAVNKISRITKYQTEVDHTNDPRPLQIMEGSNTRNETPTNLTIRTLKSSHHPQLFMLFCGSRLRSPHCFKMMGQPIRNRGKYVFPIKIDDQIIEFATDSGSDANILSPSSFEKLQRVQGRTIPLQTDTSDDFRSITDEEVSFHGYFLSKISYGQITLPPERIYISRNRKSPNLLSESACLDLGLITYAPGGRFIRSTLQTKQERNLLCIGGL